MEKPTRTKTAAACPFDRRFGTGCAAAATPPGAAPWSFISDTFQFPPVCFLSRKNWKDPNLESDESAFSPISTFQMLLVLEASNKSFSLDLNFCVRKDWDWSGTNSDSRREEESQRNINAELGIIITLLISLLLCRQWLFVKIINIQTNKAKSKWHFYMIIVIKN